MRTTGYRQVAFLRIGLPYALLASAYILLSTWFAESIAFDRAEALQIELAKGLGFVLVTALLLTLLSGRLLARVAEQEKLLAQETARKVVLFEALPGPVVELDLEGRLKSWNQQVPTITGRTGADLAGRSAEDFIDAEDRSAIRESIHHVLSTGETRMTAGRLMTADGGVVPYLWSGAPVIGDGGAIVGSVSFGQDISRERRTADSLRAQVEAVERLLFQTVRAITLAMEARDAYTAGHQHTVARIAVRIGRKLGLKADRLKGLELAAEVHDIGKLAVPVEILTLPRRLSAPEMAIVRSHAEWGHRILSEVDFPWPVADIVHQHHERLDGSGYPLGLVGDAILPEARILAVADVIEAMTSHRPYRAGLGRQAALDELRRGSGTLYDAAAVEACAAVAEGWSEA